MAEVLTKGSVFLSRGRRSSSFPPMTKTRPLRFPSPSMKNVFFGKRLVVESQMVRNRTHHTVPVKMTLAIPKSMRWWEKGVQPNMKEITSAQDLVDSLLNAGDKLVVVDFFSPGCAGCRALHPKICQFAERNPDVLFLQVNYEDHKSMCYSLNVHVLPFFRFYRGANGRLCSFSCTNATIKKFKEAMAKHNVESCSLGPTMGLNESELLALAANKDLCFSYTKKEEEEEEEAVASAPIRRESPFSTVPLDRQGSDGKALVASRR